MMLAIITINQKNATLSQIRSSKIKLKTQVFADVSGPHLLSTLQGKVTRISISYSCSATLSALVTLGALLVNMLCLG